LFVSGRSFSLRLGSGFRLVYFGGRFGLRFGCHCLGGSTFTMGSLDVLRQSGFILQGLGALRTLETTIDCSTVFTFLLLDRSSLLSRKSSFFSGFSWLIIIIVTLVVILVVILVVVVIVIIIVVIVVVILIFISVVVLIVIVIIIIPFFLIIVAVLVVDVIVLIIVSVAIVVVVLLGAMSLLHRLSMGAERCEEEDCEDDQCA